LLTTSIEACQNNPSYPNFFGTSAATPHAASIAALMLQANPTLTPAQIYKALQMSALPMSGTTPNYVSGYGFIQADAALALVPAGAPTLSLSETTGAIGASATLTWSSVNTQSCTASGSWSGAQATSGSLIITPMAASTLTYTLTCGNPVGSAVSSASLKVTAASASGGGGGGALESLTLLALAALGGVRLLRRWRRHAVPRAAGRTSRRATSNPR
jgi:subtilisin family serine protease